MAGVADALACRPAARAPARPAEGGQGRGEQFGVEKAV